MATNAPPVGMAEAMELLRSIDRSLRTIAVLAQAKAEARVKQSQNATPKASQKVATDADMDGKYGDPIVKVEPRDWSGPSMKERRYSQCPAEYLDLLAEMLDYFAENDEREDKRTANGKPTAGFRRADAARARGWAARVRAGHPATRGAASDDQTPEGWA